MKFCVENLCSRINQTSHIQLHVSSSFLSIYCTVITYTYKRHANDANGKYRGNIINISGTIFLLSEFFPFSLSNEEPRHFVFTPPFPKVKNILFLAIINVCSRMQERQEVTRIHEDQNGLHIHI